MSFVNVDVTDLGNAVPNPVLFMGDSWPVRGHIQTILKKINVIMTLRGEGVWAMTLKVAGCEGEKGSYMRIPNPDMNIMLRAIVRNTVNECGQDLYRTGVKSECLLEACLPSS